MTQITPLTFHSKLVQLQGQPITTTEETLILSQIRSILHLENSGKISVSEAAARIRSAAWKIAEDLRINDLDLGSGSDESLLENLPALLKI